MKNNIHRKKEFTQQEISEMIYFLEKAYTEQYIANNITGYSIIAHNGKIRVSYTRHDIPLHSLYSNYPFEIVYEAMKG